MSDNKVTDSQIAYYVDNSGNRQLITTDDALLRLENGVTLRDHLFDVKEYNEGRNVPLKFVYSTKKRSYFATKALKVNRIGTVSEGNDILHTEAKNTLAGVDYSKICLGRFYIASSFITSVRVEETLSFSDKSTGKVVTIRPDVIISTAFMDFFVEIKVTHGLEENTINNYKLYRKYGDYDIPFTVYEVDLSDLQDKVRSLGFDSVKDEVYSRLLEPSDYKHYIPITTLNIKDAPFGYNPKSGLPFKLVINTYADAISKGLREFVKNNSDASSSIVIKSIEEDGLHSLFLTDDSSEHPLFPLNCPTHEFEPLHLVKQAENRDTDWGRGLRNNGQIFLKCGLYTSKRSRTTYVDYSMCDFTITCFTATGTLNDEFLIIGDFANFISNKDDIARRLVLLRNSYQEYHRGE